MKPSRVPTVSSRPVYRIEEPKFSDLGSANLNCPHCNGKLMRFPQRKTKCPYCDRIIYSRSRPLDRRKVLLNDEESEMVEKEWAIFNKHQHLIRIISSIIPGDADPVIAQAYADLCASGGTEPSVPDILNEINNKKSEECLKTGMFGQFRYHVLFSSDIFKYEGQDRDSLRLLLQVMYLDLNGISNTGNAKNKPVFNLKNCSKSPDLLGEIRALKTVLNLDNELLKSLFCESATEISTIFTPHKPPVKPEDAWSQISSMVE